MKVGDRKDEAHEHHGLEEIHHEGVLRVRRCGCGVVYLGIGPVTVQITAGALEQVTAGLVEAKRILAGARPEIASPPLFGWMTSKTSH